MLLFSLLVPNAANNIRAPGAQASARDDNKETSTALASLCSERELHPPPSERTAENITENRSDLLSRVQW